MDDKLRYAEAERVTGIRRETLYSMVSRRQIPHIRLGRRLVVFSRAELERWLDAHKVACSTPSKPSR